MEMIDAASIRKKAITEQYPLSLQCKLSNLSYNILFPGILQSKIIANCKDLSATSKTIYASNLAYSMEKDDMYVLFFMLVVFDYFVYCFFNFDIVQGVSFQKLWRNC